jgi:hypothetical protein
MLEFGAEIAILFIRNQTGSPKFTGKSASEAGNSGIMQETLSENGRLLAGKGK